MYFCPGKWFYFQYIFTIDPPNNLSSITFLLKSLHW